MTDGRTDGQTDGQTDRILLAIPRRYDNYGTVSLTRHVHVVMYVQHGTSYDPVILCTGTSVGYIDLICINLDENARKRITKACY